MSIRIRLLPACTLAALAITLAALPVPATAANDFGRSPADLEMEEFLSTAELLTSEEVGEGITKPVRLTLSDGSSTHRAIFKTVDETIDQLSRTSGFEAKFTDKYAYEVAAYRIDRLVGIGLVPPTVLRTVDGTEGSAQYWIENISTMKAALVEHGDQPVENFDLLLERLTLTYILDALIYNIDRNHGNILVDFSDDRFFPIDHSRAFRLYKKIPPMKETEVQIPPQVASGLRQLDLETLRHVLDGLLDGSQIKAIDKRRRVLIKELEKRGLM